MIWRRIRSAAFCSTTCKAKRSFGWSLPNACSIDAFSRRPRLVLRHTRREWPTGAHVPANCWPVSSPRLSQARMRRVKMFCSTTSISLSCCPGSLGGRTKWLKTDSSKAMVTNARRLKYAGKKLQKNTTNARKPFEAFQVDLAWSSPLVNEVNVNPARMAYPTHCKRGRGLRSIRL